MAKKSEVSSQDKLVFASLLILCANVLAARYWGYPFLYCWLSPVTATLYMAWGTVILYVVSAYIVFQLFRRGTAQALGGTLIFIAIIELPRLADMVFRMGGSCG